MTDPLQVRLSGEVIGVLHKDGSFAWDSTALATVPLNAPVLSHSLPRGDGERDAAPFFGGLLPEGNGLEQLAKESRVASSNLYGLLAEVGADVGGSVTIGEPRPPVEPITLQASDFEGVLQHAYGYLKKSAVGGGGSSAAGVQRKVALTWDPSQDRWQIGRGSTPSTHILKPVQRENARALRAESYLNGLARELGLSTHVATVEAAGDLAVLVVERYDRVRSSAGDLVRLHQEDAAQALGLPWGGNDKYESVNPRANLRAIAQLLDRGRSIFSTAESDQERLLALVTLNVVAGNTDAHAKNFSLMLPPVHQEGNQRWVGRLADAYDLVPQSLLRVEQEPFAMRVGGESGPGNVTVEHLHAEGEQWGLKRARVETVVAETLDAIEAAVDRAVLPENDAQLVQYLLLRVENLRRGDRVWTRSTPPALLK